MEIAGRLLRDPFAFLCACLALDAFLGDPQYGWHPIRLLGRLLAASERLLRRAGWDGRAGGFLLFLILAGAGAAAWGLGVLLGRASLALGLAWKLYLGYSLLALGDLVAHGRRIARATQSGDLEGARAATARLVGRDVDRMDLSACNRAAVESLAESLVDGVLSPLFWFALLGLPGLIGFKIASTMDSMVGYKNERYLRFGWFGARLDDVLNWLPARLGYALIVLFAALAPGYSARKSLRAARQHGLLPGPNKGWSETAAAGALGLRLAGPIWKDGTLVNELWIGVEGDREHATPRDVGRAVVLLYGVSLLFLGSAWLLFYRTGFMHGRPWE